MNRESQKAPLDPEFPQVVADYLEACRQRIPEFIDANYAWPGALDLNRHAFGTDILAAPFNFLMGFPNFVLQAMAWLLGAFGARRAARLLVCSHLGLPTRVQMTIRSRLMTELLGFSEGVENLSDHYHQQLDAAVQEPVRIYVQTRNVAADITAGTLAAVMGLFLLHQFTPGSISVGSAVAQVVAKERAVSEFPLGETLGGVYYAVFPATPSLMILGLVFLSVMVTIAVVAAFSGLIHDPVQIATGIHRRRLNRMLDAIEESACEVEAKGYRPKDTLFGRVYDLVDWVKGLLSF